MATVFKPIIRRNGDTYVMKIDHEDYIEISDRSTYVVPSKEYVYAAQMRDGKNIKIHRKIMCAPDNLFVDHINHDTLDNRKRNLRLCTRQENKRNSRCCNRTGFKGVSSQKLRWKAEIHDGTDKIYLGSFKTKESAALAYNVAAIKYFGNFAKLNKIK